MDKNFELKFCGKIRALRTERGLSVQKLSEESGVPLELLEQLERNIISENMMVGHAIDLARMFGCEAHQLFE